MTVPLITSLQNPQVKRLVRLRTRRAREEEGVILIEGAREVARAAQAGVRLSEVFLCPPLFSPEAAALGLLELSLLEPGLPKLGLPEVPVTHLTPAAFEKVSGRENPDGVLALAPTTDPRLGDPPPDAVVVVLHGLEKPGNVGAILRTADSVGAHAVMILGRGADPFSPNVIRASQGSVWHLPTVALPEEEAWSWLEKHAFRTVACTPDAPQVYWDAPLSGRVALLLGTEHAGLPQAWRDTDEAVSIPMQGGADSLNVATAAALVLYECARQRRLD